MRHLTSHPTHHVLPRSLCTVLVVLTLLPLLGCKRSDMVTQWAPASPSPVAYLEDGVITSRVRAALILSPVVNSYNISVESHQGVVLLSGMAADPTQIDLAVFVAQTVPGVNSVDSFMFSTGAAPALAVRQGHTPDLAALRARQLLDALPSQLYQEPQPPHPIADEPSDPASAVYATAEPVPLAQEPDPATDTPAQGMPRLSRWVRLAHSVLGIGSIQDELQIKR
ncbi:BON domain-containing protein [Acidovorax sp.]|uniref:BON domain-containing protein n=1 Tax=Acidovorax sp. TaxID=1872122 RepID=UPI0025BC47EA|nr:BON domain-containing protein [Acidovorax sp.]MBL7090427.1 BON domain-containing protein [Acidovorax sp.]